MTEDSRQHLALLQGRVARLTKLLEDLLQYSRAGRQQAEIRTVDLGCLVPEVFGLVATEQSFDLQMGSAMPSVETAPAPLEQVLRNLIGNAIKHHDRPQGRITVTVTDRDERLEFAVGDDGPGVPKRYQQRIFGMFQTLKSRDEVEGSGMGLAIIRKLVESVDCSIDIESDPELGRGSLFRFTWPKRWPTALTAGAGD